MFGLLGAVLGWLSYHLGIRGTDTASATGSLHSKLLTILGKNIITKDTVIKSIQRGTIVLINVNSNTATISAVVTAKTKLNWLGQTLGSDVLPDMVRLSLTNTTTITATRINSTADVSTVSFEAIEYY